MNVAPFFDQSKKNKLYILPMDGFFQKLIGRRSVAAYLPVGVFVRQVPRDSRSSFKRRNSNPWCRRGCRPDGAAAIKHEHGAELDVFLLQPVHEKGQTSNDANSEWGGKYFARNFLQYPPFKAWSFSGLFPSNFLPPTGNPRGNKKETFLRIQSSLGQSP